MVIDADVPNSRSAIAMTGAIGLRGLESNPKAASCTPKVEANG
jgi:hypothetical protein